ncbi:hypothetical protein DL98DRAFT_515720 [Cadophora sp. DSE1049]|nr:hypothetical protein DL98DRAFT_515720 [Cadophora sp. DSE1049]
MMILDAPPLVSSDLKIPVAVQYASYSNHTWPVYCRQRHRISKHIVRRDDGAAPTETDIKTAEAPKRFIVEFAEVSFEIL